MVDQILDNGTHIWLTIRKQCMEVAKLNIQSLINAINLHEECNAGYTRQQRAG